MKYCNCIANPQNGKLVYKDDVRRLARILNVTHWTSSELYLAVCEDVIAEHGYDHF